MLRPRFFLAPTALALACSLASGVALADDGAQAFVQKEQAKVLALMQQPASAAREAGVDRASSTPSSTTTSSCAARSASRARTASTAA